MNWLNLVLSGVVSAFMPILVVSNITKEKTKMKDIIVFALITIPLLMINYLYFDGITRLILNILIMIIAFYFSVFNKDISKSVFYTFVYEALVFITEIILSVIIKLLFSFNSGDYADFSFSLLAFSILDGLLIYLFSKVKFIKDGILKFNRLTLNGNKDWIYMLIVVILLACLLTFNKYNLDSNVNFYINAGMVIFVLLSLIYVISNKFSKQRYEDKYNQMMEYVCKYEKIINEQGKKNH